jgi:CBS domain containing-hemolysin-like protein
MQSKLIKRLRDDSDGEDENGAERLMSIFEAGAEDGVLEEDEREMLHGVIEFGDIPVREVMVPRMDMVCSEVSKGIDHVMTLIEENGFSRIPVYEGKVDNIIGMVYAKDLLLAMCRQDQTRDVRELMRPAYFVPESKKIDELLREFKRQKTHIAMVVDEYGGTAGLVTLEDVLEEIVGEIQDEYDKDEEPSYEALGASKARVSGRMSLRELGDLLDLELPSDDFDTLGGFIYHLAGKVPSEGEELAWNGLVLRVERVRGRRIEKVILERAPERRE